jgi:hypothetical protein
MTDPDPQLLMEFATALAAYQEQGQHLADLTERVAWARLRAVLPTARSAEVEGSISEDWLHVLRVRRIRDADGAVLFDVAQGADRAIEETVDEIGTEYLDLLLDLTGDAYMGQRVLTAP